MSAFWKKYTEHECPRWDKSGNVPRLIRDAKCAVCSADSKAYYAEFVPYLAEMKAFIEDGGDFSSACSQILYEHFMDDLDYGTRTGDTGTIDEWLCDHDEYVSDLVDTIESYFPSEAA